MGLISSAVIPNQEVAVKCRFDPTLHNQGLVLRGPSSIKATKGVWSLLDWLLPILLNPDAVLARCRSNQLHGTPLHVIVDIDVALGH
jgi:hypothetical protein